MKKKIFVFLVVLFMYGCGKVSLENKCHAIALKGKVTDCVSYQIPKSDFRGVSYSKHFNNDVFTIRYITIWDNEVFYDVPYPFPNEKDYKLEEPYPKTKCLNNSELSLKWVFTKKDTDINHSVFLVEKNKDEKKLQITLPRSDRGYIFRVNRYDDKDLIYYFDAGEDTIASGIFEYVVVQ